MIACCGNFGTFFLGVGKFVESSTVAVVAISCVVTIVTITATASGGC